jgi:ankyrin repeat protein
MRTAVDLSKWKQLRHAAMQHHVGAIAALLDGCATAEERYELAAHRDANGFTVLMLAAMQNNADALLMLLSMAAPPRGSGSSWPARKTSAGGRR